MDTSVMICEDEPARKRFCPDYLSVMYASGSNADLYDEDDDKESVYSWQSYETAWVADSGDDYSLTEDDGESSLTEFELAEEDTVEEETHCSSDSSTSANDIHFPEGLLPSPPADSSSHFTDESGWDDCNGETDGCFGTKSQTTWKCLKCRAPTAAPRNFCFTCYQKRKSSRPPRPERRLKKSGRTKTSGTSAAANNDAMLISTAPAGTATSNDNNMCTVCHVHIRDGAFVHRKTAHVACCFSCTEKISKNRNAKCPICRQSIQNTIKIFFN